MIDNKDFEFKQILFLFAAEGDKLSFRNDNILIMDRQGKVKHQSTCYRLFLLCVVGHITITSGLIQRAKKFGFSICLFTTTMRLYTFIDGGMEGNTLLHKYQYEYEGLAIGQSIVKNKICNQRASLNSIRNKTVECKNAIARLDEHISKLDSQAFELKQLLGIERSAARTYFKCIFDNEEWKGRQPRVKADYLNSTLDIGYTILFNFIEALLRIYDFDIYKGVLHKAFYMRKSLVCDLVEPIRPVIDLQIRKSINLYQFKEEDFQLYNRRYELKWKKSPEYTSVLLKPLLEHKNDIFLYIRDCYRAFMKHKNADEFPVFKI